MCGRTTYERKERFTSQLSNTFLCPIEGPDQRQLLPEINLAKASRLTGLRGLIEKRLIPQWFAGRLGQQVVEQHVLGGLRGGFVRSDLRGGERSPSTKQ